MKDAATFLSSLLDSLPFHYNNTSRADIKAYLVNLAPNLDNFQTEIQDENVTRIHILSLQLLLFNANIILNRI